MSVCLSTKTGKRYGHQLGLNCGCSVFLLSTCSSCFSLGDENETMENGNVFNWGASSIQCSLHFPFEGGASRESQSTNSAFHVQVNWGQSTQGKQRAVSSVFWIHFDTVHQLVLRLKEIYCQHWTLSSVCVAKCSTVYFRTRVNI